jgi:tetratricopeptide (TPR) repeat protein
LEKALALDPNHSYAHLWIASLYVSADVPQSAEMHLKYLSLLRPNDPEVLEVRGLMYAQENHPDLAERDLLRAYDLGSHRDYIAERLSELYLRHDQADKARAILSRTAERSPDRSQLLLALARLEETEGNPTQAESAYRMAVAAKDDVENNERLGQFLARNGQIREAENVLRKVDGMQPASPTAAADLALLTGRAHEALSSYRSAYQKIQAHSSPRASSQSARALIARMVEANLTDSAISAARQHLEKNGSDLDPSSRKVLQAEIDLSSGDLPAAERSAADAVQDVETAAAAHYVLGAISAQRGQNSEAAAHWQAALDADEKYVPARLSLAAKAIEKGEGIKAEEYVIEVVRDEPLNVQALLLYSRALLLQNRCDSARALAERAGVAAPRNAEIAIVLGDIALREHHLASALLQYEKAMLLEPHSDEAMQGLAEVYKKGRISLPMLRKLETLAQSPTPSSRLLEITGRLYESRHRYADATRCLERSVTLDPNRRSALLALAQTYLASGKVDKSRDLLSIPDLSNVARDRSRASLLTAALRAQRHGDSNQAIHHYEEVVRAGDQTGIASNNLAWIYAMQGQKLDRALELAQHAFELNPGSPQILDTLGVIQIERRQFSQAISSFETGARRAVELRQPAQQVRIIEGHLAEARKFAGQPSASQ